MLELYNMTNDIKRVPRYRYTGEYVLKPKGSVPIHEEHAYFYKPYAQIGVVVRVSKSSMPEQQVLDIKSENTPKSNEKHKRVNFYKSEGRRKSNCSGFRKSSKGDQKTMEYRE